MGIYHSHIISQTPKLSFFCFVFVTFERRPCGRILRGLIFGVAALVLREVDIPQPRPAGPALGPGGSWWDGCHLMEDWLRVMEQWAKKIIMACEKAATATSFDIQVTDGKKMIKGHLDLKVNMDEILAGLLEDRTCSNMLKQFCFVFFRMGWKYHRLDFIVNVTCPKYFSITIHIIYQGEKSPVVTKTTGTLHVFFNTPC